MAIQTFCIISLMNVVVASTLSFEENESFINQLKPTIVEAEILHYESKYDDQSLELIKELTISSDFYLSTQETLNTNDSCIGLNADLSKARVNSP